MGPLFVISFWLSLAALFGVSAAGLVWVGQRRQPRNVRWRRTFLIAALPFMVLLWMPPASVLWHGWGMLTGMDADFLTGDSWGVELPNGYELGFFDTAAEASILRRGGVERTISEITHIGVEGDIVFGTTLSGTFVLDTSGNNTQPDYAALIARTPLVRVNAFSGRPYTLLDQSVWWGILLLPPLLLARRLWMPRSRELSVAAPRINS